MTEDFMVGVDENDGGPPKGNDLHKFITRPRDGPPAASSGLNLRLYAQHEANFNETALVNTGGSVAERFVDSPYGTTTILSPSWTTFSGTAYSFNLGFQ